MPDLRRATCTRCKRHRSTCGPISWSGLCQDCAVNAVVENVVGLGTLSGEPLRRWRYGVITSAGGLLPDDPVRP